MAMRPAAPATVIEPQKGLSLTYFSELYEYRELFFFLTWRDIKVRYKQTVFGVAWAILQPLLTALVFTLFFGKVAGISSDGVPYPLFSYTGLLIWTFFAQSLTQSSQSLVASADLVRKVYFPRLVVPLAAVFACLVDLAVASPVLIAMMIWYGVAPGLQVLAVPGLVLLALVTAVGIGLWLSALNVEYRDVRYVVPFLIQIWLFITPVIWPASVVVPRITSFGIPEWVLGLNPMGGVVEGLRWAVLGVETSPLSLILTSSVVALLLLLSGALYFRRVERTFADVV